MNFFEYALLILVIFVSSTCKKKTTIDVQVFNYALNEPVANAKVVLVERKTPGLLSGNFSCEEIANAITDGNGVCSFSKEKLKTRSRYQYYLAVSEIYGKEQSYPCGGKTSDFLKVGDIQTSILESGRVTAFFKVQLNNLLNPSQPGDSIIINIRNPEFTVPGRTTSGGGGVYSTSAYYDGNGNASPVSISELQNTDSGKNTVHIRKRKLGVVTTTVDTVKIYPYETKIIEINW